MGQGDWEDVKEKLIEMAAFLGNQLSQQLGRRIYEERDGVGETDFLEIYWKRGCLSEGQAACEPKNGHTRRDA